MKVSDIRNKKTDDIFQACKKEFEKEKKEYLASLGIKRAANKRKIKNTKNR